MKTTGELPSDDDADGDGGGGGDEAVIVCVGDVVVGIIYIVLVTK